MTDSCLAARECTRARYSRPSPVTRYDHGCFTQGTPTKEQIKAMNPNHKSFALPELRPHPWDKVFKGRVPADALDLVPSAARRLLHAAACWLAVWRLWLYLAVWCVVMACCVGRAVRQPGLSSALSVTPCLSV